MCNTGSETDRKCSLFAVYVREMWFTERPDRSCSFPVCTSSFSTELRQHTFFGKHDKIQYINYAFKSPLNKMIIMYIQNQSEL